MYFIRIKGNLGLVLTVLLNHVRFLAVLLDLVLKALLDLAYDRSSNYWPVINQSDSMPKNTWY
jgi:hypothetical protein